MTDDEAILSDVIPAELKIINKWRELFCVTSLTCKEFSINFDRKFHHQFLLPLEEYL